MAKLGCMEGPRQKVDEYPVAGWPLVGSERRFGYPTVGRLDSWYPLVGPERQREEPLPSMPWEALRLDIKVVA
jgi:hypothetical protein